MHTISISPNLIVKDVNATVGFYTKTLGFNFVMGVDDDKQLYLAFDEAMPLGFAIVQNGKVQIMFQEINNAKNDGLNELQIDAAMNNINLYLEVEGLDDYYHLLQTKEVTIVKIMHHTFYGMKEFYIKDYDGNIIGFAEKLV